jgi:hypothetical protein
MRLALFLSYGAVIWLAAVVAAPLLALSGSAAAVVAGLVVYRAASVVCHQIPERSFQLATLPLAVCARCLGLYVGAGAAGVAALLDGRRSRLLRSGARTLFRPGSGIWMVLVVSAAPTAATWVLEQIEVWPASNAARFVAALPLGFAAAWIVLAALRAERADTID